MRISSFLPFLPLLVVAQLSLPDNALEGVAIHVQDEFGNITYVHESEFAQYGISVVFNNSGISDTNLTSLETRGSLPNGDSIVCDSKRTLLVEDLHSNMINFIDYLNCGFTTITNPSAKYKYVAISNYLGSSVIYICNYSGGYRHFEGFQLFLFLGQVFNYCGSRAIAGWYSQGLYQTSWGYTSSSYSFCGPVQN